MHKQTLKKSSSESCSYTPETQEKTTRKKPWWLYGLWGIIMLFDIAYVFCFGWISIDYENIVLQIQTETFPKRILYWQDYVTGIIETGRMFPMVLVLSHLISIVGLVVIWKRKYHGLLLYGFGIVAHAATFLYYKGLAGTSPGEIMLGVLFVILLTYYRKYFDQLSGNSQGQIP